MADGKERSTSSLADAALENLKTGLLLVCKERLVTAIQDTRLDRLDLRVLATLIMHMNGKTARTWLGRVRVAELLGVEAVTVSNRLRTLKTLEYLIGDRERVPEANNRSLTVYTLGRIDDATIRDAIVSRAAGEKVTTGGDIQAAKSPPPVINDVTFPGDFHPKVTTGSRPKSPQAVDSNSNELTQRRDSPLPPRGRERALLVENLLKQVVAADESRFHAVQCLLGPIVRKLELDVCNEADALAYLADQTSIREIPPEAAKLAVDSLVRQRTKKVSIRHVLEAAGNAIAQVRMPTSVEQSATTCLRPMLKRVGNLSSSGWIRLTPAPSTIVFWNVWLDHLKITDPQKAQQAVRDGFIDVTKNWPTTPGARVLEKRGSGSSAPNEIEASI